MSRDYKPTMPQGKNKGNPFLVGFLIGLLVGVGLSVGVALLIMGGESPFTNRVTPAPTIEQSLPVNPENKEKPAETGNNTPDTATSQNNSRFDFYNILPGNESPVSEQEIRQKESTAGTDTNSDEQYFLQVGAFQSEQDADNMKAKLALLGLEAIVQTTTLPEKGVWHRVRVGPFSEVGQINRTRAELAKNGFHTDLVKVKAEAVTKSE